MSGFGRHDRRYARLAARRTWKAAVVLTTAAGLLLASGCQSPRRRLRLPRRQRRRRLGPSTATIRFEPGADATDVLPTAPVSVVAQGGTLTSVAVVDGKGRALDGALDGSKTRWTAASALLVAQHYNVTAKAVDPKGVAVERTATFSTLKPKGTLKTSISPLSGSRSASACRSSCGSTSPSATAPPSKRGLLVTSRKPIDGAWSWISDTEVHYRPEHYWPDNDKVTIDVRLRGVQAGKNIWSMENRTITFKTPAAMVSTVDVARHT